MKYDDKIRSQMGLAVCLRDMGNGKSRIFMDDIISNKQENPIEWTHDCFYTFTPELDSEAMSNMNLSEKDFQNIGAAVVARLLALNGKLK